MHHITRGGRRGHPTDNAGSPTAPPESPLSPRRRSISRTRARRRLSRYGSFNDTESVTPQWLMVRAREVDQKFYEIKRRQAERQTGESQLDGPELSTHNDLNCMSRDRYSNIRPWLHNTCALKVPPSANSYVNASPIELTSRNGSVKRWIATQGPVTEQFHLFWRLVWQETDTVAVIIMLTRFIDLDGRPKCAQYFPLNKDETWEINDSESQDGFAATLTVVDVQVNKRAGAALREIRMKVGDEEKTVWHVFFEAWPDHGVPREVVHKKAIVELIKVANEKNSRPENPIIVHCSAGVGRSGTYIALDYFFREIEHNCLDRHSDQIFSVVDSLRCQRPEMVQTADQFKFIYSMTRERLQQAVQERSIPPVPAIRRNSVGTPGNSQDTASQGSINGTVATPTRSRRPGLRSEGSFLGL